MNDNRTYSGRSILKALGVGQVQATFALRQVMHLAPRSSDPDAGATVIVVKAVQRGLNALGCTLNVSGLLDTQTMLCLSRISGPNWESRPWMKITKDIVSMRDAGLKIDDGSHGSLEGLDGVPSSFSKLGGLALIAGVAFLALKHKK